MKEAPPETELYQPRPAELVKVTELTPEGEGLRVPVQGWQELGQRPGQFVEVSVLGIGEAPISISSSPTRGETFQLAIRNVGNVTNALHKLKAGRGRGHPRPVRQRLPAGGPGGQGHPVRRRRHRPLPAALPGPVRPGQAQLLRQGHPALRGPVAGGAAVPGRAGRLEPRARTSSSWRRWTRATRPGRAMWA